MSDNMEDEVDALRLKLFNLLLHLNSAQPVNYWEIHGSAGNALYRALGCPSKRILENILFACKFAKLTGVHGNEVRIRFDSKTFNKYLKHSTNPVCKLHRHGKLQLMYLQFGYGKPHKDLWKQSSILPRFKKGGVVCEFHLDQVVRKAAQTRPKAAAVTFREGGSLNEKPARKRSNIDRTPSRVPVLLSPMPGNRPRLTDTPGGLANPPRQLNNSEQMTVSEPIRRRLNLDDHVVCLPCSQPITEAGIHPEYHNECLQCLLMDASSGPSDRTRQYHPEAIGRNPRVNVQVPNGWILKRRDHVTKLENEIKQLRNINAVLARKCFWDDKNSLSRNLIGAYVARNPKASQATLEETHALSC